MTSLFPIVGLWLALFSFSLRAQNIEILETHPEAGEVVVMHEHDRNFALLDRICFYRGDVEIACGDVTFTNPKNATVTIRKVKEGVTRKLAKENKQETWVELEFGRESVKATDRAERIVPEANEVLDADAAALVESLVQLRQAASETRNALEGKEDLTIDTPAVPDDTDERFMGHGCLSNFSMGLNYIFPTMQYQQAISKHISIGVMPEYMTTPVSNGSVTGIGTFLTMNRYSIEPFHGDWLMIGMGFFKLTGKTGGVTEEYTSPAIVLNAGWRWFWDSGINFGFGLGVQYFLKPKPSGGALQFSGLLPSIALDLGYAF